MAITDHRAGYRFWFGGKNITEEDIERLENEHPRYLIIGRQRTSLNKESSIFSGFVMFDSRVRIALLERILPRYKWHLARGHTKYIINGIKMNALTREYGVAPCSSTCASACFKTCDGKRKYSDFRCPVSDTESTTSVFSENTTSRDCLFKDKSHVKYVSLDEIPIKRLCFNIIGRGIEFLKGACVS